MMGMRLRKQAVRSHLHPFYYVLCQYICPQDDKHNKPLLEYGIDDNADNLRQWRVGSSNVKLLQIISFFEVSFGRVVGKVYFCGILNV